MRRSYGQAVSGGTLGPRYIKDLQGPLGYIPLIAVGGVDVKNMKDFLDAASKAWASEALWQAPR